MDFEKKVPEWDNVGAEPDAQLKKEGFKAGYKPPAAYFNWFFNRISEVAKELQEKAGNEIDNKPDASGGDISDTVITSAEEPKDDYPVPAAGDSTKVFLGKTRKFFGDIKNWMTGVCLLGQIVNNCVTDNAKLPLSAAQGKALMDLYNVLNTNDQNIKKQLNGWRFETTTNIADFNQTNVSNVNRVLIGIINLTGYISFDINWIRLQFQCTGDDAVYCRIIYGSHTSAKWIKIA